MEDQTNPSSSGKSPSWWGGCLVPLTIALLVLGAIGYGLLTLYRGSDDHRQDVDRRWLRPWVAAVEGDQLERVWPTLTTDRLRRARSLADTQRTYRTAIERWGRPSSVEIHVVNGQYDALTGRSFERVETSWAFERGTHLFITFDLVATPDGYRLDDSRPGGGPGTVRPLPADVPDGPW